MSVILVDEGLNQYLADQLNVYLNDIDLTVRLFTNDLILSKATELADLTECNYDGYVGQVPTWDHAIHATAVNGHIATMIWHQLTFAGGGTTPNTITGWYMSLLDGSEPFLFFAQMLTTPYVMDGGSKNIKIIPKINVRST